MKKTPTLLDTLVKEVISESVRINFMEHQFILKVSTNEDPNKTGIKVQFIPVNPQAISQTVHNDIAIKLQQKLDEGLKEYGLQVERDRDLKNKTIVGFFIYIEYVEKIIRSVLQSQSN